MTFKEKLDRLEGIYAYDTGSVSSGIQDPVFKQWLKDEKNNEEVLTLLKSLLVVYMNEKEYTFEDAISIVEWAKRELNF